MKLLLVKKPNLVSERLVALLLRIGGVEAVETAADIEQALSLLQSVQPGIVLMDSCLSDGKAIQALPRFKDKCPATCVIVMSPYIVATYRRRQMSAGADYLFDIDTQLDELVSAVSKVAATAPSTTVASTRTGGKMSWKT